MKAETIRALYARKKGNGGRPSRAEVTNACLELARQIGAAGVTGYRAMNMQATEWLRLHGLHTP